MPNPRDVQVSKALTNVSIGYPTQNYIAENLLATVPVNHLDGQYYIFDTERRAISTVTDYRTAVLEHVLPIKM